MLHFIIYFISITIYPGYYFIIFSNEQLSIEQMFCVRRGVEEDNFRKQLHPQKLLFHASKVQNFVGILSR